MREQAVSRCISVHNENMLVEAEHDHPEFFS